MLTRSLISLSLRLALLLAFWLGALACPASSGKARQPDIRAQLTIGHQPTEPGFQFSSAAMLEQAALLPAVPQVPAVLVASGLPPVALAWLRPVWPSAVGLPTNVRPCALPDLFRVRLLLTAVAPNAP
ncbi:hypothetical protein [Hymenobacter wooponensis]|uniref:Uncharacterized protein n=1 Tax=Hymenobacter wooponensis TaxID=1525360 RepID=A0A4Z0MHZ6_9BACT|nr:hypothetical protein [Hymenobacter wooponensis]TGD78980.1 hypothetical protein EU557_18585 [Hymenobacter wooponensis]